MLQGLGEGKQVIQAMARLPAPARCAG